MSAPLRVRGTCTECHTAGRFRPVQHMVRKDRAWHWRLVVLCAVCRLHLEQLGEPERRSAAAASSST